MVEVHNSAGHVSNGHWRRELSTTCTRCAPRECTFQGNHRVVRVLVDFFQLHVLKAFLGVDGELGLLGGVHVREIVLEPGFLASDPTSTREHN